jgi:hypothetical protein
LGGFGCDPAGAVRANTAARAAIDSPATISDLRTIAF